MKTTFLSAAVLAVLVSLGVFGFTHLRTTKPVQQILDADPRNAGVVIRATHPGLIGFSTLRLDLRSDENATPVVLWRSLFQIAESFYRADRRFEHVELARNGTVVFRLSGDDFWAIGSQFDFGENPLYIVRKLPSMLKRPDGSVVQGQLAGAELGEGEREIEESAEAAHAWARGAH